MVDMLWKHRNLLGSGGWLYPISYLASDHWLTCAMLEL